MNLITYINGAPALYEKYAVFGGCDGFLHMVNIETGKVFKKISFRNLHRFVARD